MVDRLSELLPTQEFRGYCEPFLGGGAMFRHLAAKGQLSDCESILGDAGPGVARTWLDIKQIPDSIERELEMYASEYNAATESARKELFLRERKAWNAGKVTGARHIFLRNTAFNGLWRVNKSGDMNTPWGKYKTFKPPAVKALHYSLANSSILGSPWSITVRFAEPGWLVYVDPPYIDEFSAYTRSGFSEQEQIDLLTWCAAAQERGIHVVYSNRYQKHTLDLISKHWPAAKVNRAVRIQTVSAKTGGRGLVEELVATT